MTASLLSARAPRRSRPSNFGKRRHRTHESPQTRDRDEMEIHRMVLCYRFLKTETKRGDQRGKTEKPTKITLSQHSAPPHFCRNNTSGLNKSLKPVSSQFHLIMPFCSKLDSKQTTDAWYTLFPHFASLTPTPVPVSSKENRKERKNSDGLKVICLLG